MATQVIKFIRGQLTITDNSFMKQDNILGRVTEAERGEVVKVKVEDVWDTVKIEGFFNTLIQPAQTEPVEEVKEKRVKKEIN